jgi:very-short-patch-repair endonuclease
MRTSIAIAAVPIHVPWQINLIIYGGCALIAVMAIIAAAARSRAGSKRRGGRFFNKCPQLLTPAELNFLTYLEQAVNNRWRIALKVRMRDLIYIQNNGSESLRLHNKTNQKHVDFVLCSNSTTEPLLVIELDDRSHSTLEQQEKDRWKDFCLEDAGLQIMRQPWNASYDVRRLEAEILRRIR